MKGFFSTPWLYLVKKKEITMDQMNKQTMAGQDMNQKKGGYADKTGEAVEKIGTAIGNVGATGLGKKIHDAGDNLEKTHKNPNHSDDRKV